jgi:hypothetical protein
VLKNGKSYTTTRPIREIQQKLSAGCWTWRAGRSNA